MLPPSRQTAPPWPNQNSTRLIGMHDFRSFSLLPASLCFPCQNPFRPATPLGCFGHDLPFRPESVCRAPCLRPFLSPSPCLGKSSVKECLVMCSRPRFKSTLREGERSLPGLPANVCHRFIVKLSSVQLTVDESNPLGKTHNNSNPHKTPQNLSRGETIWKCPPLNCICIC